MEVDVKLGLGLACKSSGPFWCFAKAPRQAQGGQDYRSSWAARAIRFTITFARSIYLDSRRPTSLRIQRPLIRRRYQLRLLICPQVMKLPFPYNKYCQLQLCRWPSRKSQTSNQKLHLADLAELPRNPLHVQALKGNRKHPFPHWSPSLCLSLVELKTTRSPESLQSQNIPRSPPRNNSTKPQIRWGKMFLAH